MQNATLKLQIKMFKASKALINFALKFQKVKGESKKDNKQEPGTVNCIKKNMKWN
jgi:hypothetical protein